MYGSLLATEPPEDPVLVRRCRLVWRRRIPLKIKVFGWLLIQNRLMTRSLRQRFIPEADDGCVMCSSATEDCSHLFFECPLVQTVWNEAALEGIDVTAADAFWQSICHGLSGGRQSGRPSSPYYGRYGSTGTRLYLGVDPPPPMRYSMLRGGSQGPGT